MYIESKSSKLRVIGYILIAISFLYYALEPIFSQYVPGLLYNHTAFSHLTPYFFYISYLVLLTGALMINLAVINSRSLGVILIVALLGLPYPLLGILSHNYQKSDFSSIFYDLFAAAILFSLAYRLVQERKIYKLIGILLLAEWFYFDYWVAKSGQYLFLGLSCMLTDLVSVLIVIYCILEIILEKMSSANDPINYFK